MGEQYSFRKDNQYYQAFQIQLNQQIDVVSFWTEEGWCENIMDLTSKEYHMAQPHLFNGWDYIVVSGHDRLNSGLW